LRWYDTPILHFSYSYVLRIFVPTEP
jgi:hypothetical protein